jgi:hypothetical protein
MYADGLLYIMFNSWNFFNFFTLGSWIIGTIKILESLYFFFVGVAESSDSSSDFLFQRQIFVKNADRLKKGILPETKRARQLKGRCIFIQDKEENFI